MKVHRRGRSKFKKRERQFPTVAFAIALFLSSFASPSFANDLPGSKDPAGMKRYEGSEIIGYRGPKFDEYVLPLGPPTSLASPVRYEKSLAVDGQVSHYSYLAPVGRSGAEVFRNYKLEFQRLGVETLYEKGAGQRGWFGPTFQKVADDDDLSQILFYNEAEERLLVGKTRDSDPTYYLIFVTAYKDGIIPPRLQDKVQKNQVIAELIVVAPDVMERRMAFVNADEMNRAIRDSGKVALYGLHFDTDKDVVTAESQPTLKEIAQLLNREPSLRLHVVGHTDNQGQPDYNVNLSRRRAANVVQELVNHYGVRADRLDSFGCGLYAPVASNDTEDGRAKNRRVELVK